MNEIRNAFDQVLLPDSVLEMQPPNGETLINFRTNFLTNAEPFDASLKLAGHDLDFRIRATHFTWHFGDGEKRTTSKPGDRYPHLVITHEYLHKGQVTPSVDTTWTADYRLDGGEWLPVPETVTKVGAPQDLLVRTATPHLVQY